MAQAPFSYNESQNQYQYEGPIGPSKPGFVQGTADTVPEGVQFPQGSSVNYSPAQGSVLGASDTAGGGGGGVQPVQQPQAPEPASNQDILNEAEAAYNKTLGYLNEAESVIRGFQPQVEQNINQTYQSSLDAANTQKGQAERAIESEKGSAGKRFENAITAARQALNESLIGGKQRFGRGSDIYKALGEYSTTKFQQAQGQSRDTYENTLNKLNEQWQTVNENFTQNIQQLNTWKSNELLKAQEMFQNKLLEINSRRAEAEDNKSLLRIQALENMRQTIDAIKMQAYQYQQQLYSNYQSYASQFSQAANNLSAEAISGATNTGNMNAASNASINLNPIASTGGVTPVSQQFTGYVNREDENRLLA